MKRFVALTAVVFAAGLAASVAHAQQPEFMQVAGKVKQIQRGQLLLDAPGGTYVVALNPENQKPTISLEGTAEVSFLKAGIPVRFTATFDSKGKAEEPVTKLDIFTPNPVTGKFGRAKEEGGENLFTVAGQIQKFNKKTGEFTVRLGRETVTFIPAEEAEVSVRMEGVAALKFVRSGDAVSARGQGVGPVVAANRPGLLRADTIDVKLDTPLGSEVKEDDKDGGENGDKKPGDKKPATRKPPEKKPADKADDAKPGED